MGAMRPLVVGYVLKMFPRFSETFILNEILELEHRGVRVVVFSMKPPDEPMRQPGVARVSARVHVIPPLRGSGARTHLACHARCLMRSPLRYLRTLRFVVGRGTRAARQKFLVAPFIVDRARREGVEHIHAHFASGPARQAKFVSLLSGTPFSFTAHAKDLFWSGHQHGKNNKLKKRVRLAAFVVVISEYNRRFVESLGFKVPRRRLVTIYNGLDLAAWPWRRPDGRPVGVAPGEPPLLLAVGRLVRKKGFHVLIEACRRLRDAGTPFHCIIVGEGPERSNLEALVRQHDLGDRVTLAGAVAQDRLRDSYYARSALLAQPCVVDEQGDQDGIPTVLLEAMAIGLPVVATSISGIGEAVIHGETGLCIPPDDPAALAQAIDDILGSPARAADLSAGARRLMERRFDLRQNAKLLIHLMRSSARHTPRWSQMKLRERLGLPPLEDEEEDPMAAGAGAPDAVET